MKSVLKFLIGVIETTLVILYLVYEELIYETIGRPLVEYYKSLKVLERFQLFLERSPSFVLLVIFLIAFVVAEALGFLSLPLILMGPPFMILGFIIYALKVPIAAFAFWIFKENKEKLMEYRIINYIYTKLMYYVDKLKDTNVYKRVKVRVEKYKEILKNKKGFMKEFAARLKAKYKIFKNKIKKTK